MCPKSSNILYKSYFFKVENYLRDIVPQAPLYFATELQICSCGRGRGLPSQAYMARIELQDLSLSPLFAMGASLIFLI